MLFRPIKQPLLVGSISDQLDMLEQWPSVKYLTVLAVFPMKRVAESIDYSSGTIVDDLLRYRSTQKSVTVAGIHAQLCEYVQNLLYCMNAPVEGRVSRWYSVNVSMLRAQSMATLPALFGKDIYEKNSMFIHEHLQLPPAKPHFIGVLSRQAGKTQTVVVLISALALSVHENVDFDFYAQSPSTRSENVRKLLLVINHVLYAHPETTHHFRHVRGTVANDSVIEFYNDRYKCHVLIKMRTGTGDDLRGVIGRVSFADEFAFLDDHVMRHLQVIRTTRDNAHLLLLTTHGSETHNNSFAGRIINRPEDFGNGSYFENSFVCDDCKRQPDQTKCEHMIGYMPLWRDVRASMADIRAAAGDPQQLDLARRELLGIASSGNNRAVNSNTIAAVFHSPRLAIPKTFRPSPPVLWLAMDPSSGCETSSFAALFCVRGHEGQIFVLGGECLITVNVEDAAIHSVIMDTLVKIYETYSWMLGGCSLSWMFEGNNCPTMAVNFTVYTINFCNQHRIPIDRSTMYGELVSMARGAKGDLKEVEGIYWAGNSRKHNGLSVWLAAANTGRFRFAEQFISTGTTRFTQTSENIKRTRLVDGVHQTYAIQRELCGEGEFAAVRFIGILEDQMKRLSATRSGGLSAKGNKKPLMHDDVAMALLIMCDGSSSLTAVRVDE